MKKALLICALLLGAWTSPVLADTSPVQGYAWSANIGWVSFNCTNSQTCGTSNYAVNLDRDTGALSGYAWSSNIGWISFNASDVSGCPTSPCVPKVLDGKLTGWAKVLAHGEGWDGWMHLSGANYGVSFDDVKFTGYSWSDQVLGWVSWSPVLGPGVFSVGERKLTTGLSGGIGQIYVESDVCSQTTCVLSYEDGTSVTLVANPRSGYIFDTWAGDNASLCSSVSSRICTDVEMSGDLEIRAVFKTDPNPLPPPEEPSACNNCVDDDGDGKFDWLDDPGCKGDPGRNTEVEAVLMVDIVREPGTDGKVVSTPAGIDCGATCSKTYLDSERITLTSLPLKPNTVFQKWGGACIGADPSCTITMSESRGVTAHFGKAPVFLPECSDGKDNDGDGKIDFPNDPGCDSPDDDAEIDSPSALCPAGGPGICPECNDGIDNDGDGLADFPADMQCLSLNDNSESEGVNCPAAGPGECPQCNDGVDSDSDGEVDYPSDLGCFNRADDSELDPVIIGNCPKDGPSTCPQCNDGVDNDKDGKVDWSGWDADKNGTKEVPRDPSCQGDPNKNNEAGSINVIEI